MKKSMSRRAVLQSLGMTLAVAPVARVLAACASEDGTASTDAGTDATKDGAIATDGAVAADGSACAETPTETAGPYPDTTSMVSNTAGYRADVRSNVDGTNTQAGIPLTLTLSVVDLSNGCVSVGAGYAVEIWHCSAAGIYSEYNNAQNAGSTSDTYLRGVQNTDASGKVTFTTIYPGWYTPRATHVHIKLYDSSKTLLKVTQLGFPDATNTTVAGNGSPYKSANSTTNDTDQVFGLGGGEAGGHDYQIATVTGSNSAGYTATMQVGLA